MGGWLVNCRNQKDIQNIDVLTPPSLQVIHIHHVSNRGGKGTIFVATFGPIPACLVVIHDLLVRDLGADIELS